jgi:hypothetical protein
MMDSYMDCVIPGLAKLLVWSREMHSPLALVNLLENGSRIMRNGLRTTMRSTRLLITIYHEELDPTLLALLGLIIHAKWLKCCSSPGALTPNVS